MDVEREIVSVEAEDGVNGKSELKFDEFGCSERFCASWIGNRFGDHPFHQALKYWADNSPLCPVLRQFAIKKNQTLKSMSNGLISRAAASEESLKKTTTVVDLIESKSYGQLYNGSIRIAMHLQSQHDVQIGDRVVLCFTPGIEFAQAFLGCLLLGAISVPSYPPDPRRNAEVRRFQRIIEICRPKIIFTNQFYIKLVGMKRPNFYMSQNVSQNTSRKICDPNKVVGQSRRIKLPWVILEDWDNQDVKLWKVPNLGLNKIVLIQFTSGSTRDPEGVAVSYGGLIFNLHTCMSAMSGSSNDTHLKYFDVYETSLDHFFDYAISRQSQSRSRFGHHLRFATWLPLYHDMGLIGSLLSGIFSGSEILMMSPLDFLKYPSAWMKLISDWKCSGTATPNFGLDLVVRKTSDLEVLSMELSSANQNGILCGAEPIRLSTFLRFIDVGIALDDIWL